MKTTSNQITQPFHRFISGAYRSAERSYNIFELTGNGPFYSFYWETCDLISQMIPLILAKDIIIKYPDSFHASLKKEAKIELSNELHVILEDIEFFTQQQEDHLKNKFPLLRENKIYTPEADEQWQSFNKEKEDDKLLKEAPGIIEYLNEILSLLFEPSMVEVEKFISPDRIEDFLNNEIELHERKFITHTGKWDFKPHGSIADWQCYIFLLTKCFFIPDEDYKGPDKFRIKDIKKEFWAGRYGLPLKNGQPNEYYLKDSQIDETIARTKKRLPFLIIPE